jgi:hypothetical protein
METKALSNAQPRSDEEYKQEADRLMAEIRVMLDDTRRSRERGRRIAAETQVLRDQLRKRFSCGKV